MLIHLNHKGKMTTKEEFTLGLCIPWHHFAHRLKGFTLRLNLGRHSLSVDSILFVGFVSCHGQIMPLTGGPGTLLGRAGSPRTRL